MERRLLLAVVLSIIVLVSWSALMPKPQHVATQSVTASTAPALTNEQAVVSQEVPSVAAEPSLSLPPTPEVEIQLKVEKLDLIFFEQQAAVKEAIFKEFKDYKFSLNYRFYNFRPQSIQLFDFQLLARTNRILMLDSDILFFQSPSQIIEYLKCGKSFFNSDPQDFYAVPRACMNGLFGLQVMEKVNIGLVYTPGKEYYELGLIERFLEEYYNNWQHNRLGIAQAGLTLIFSKHPDLFMRLSTSYCIGKGPITSEMICNHFASGFGRQYFYIRGLAYLKKQIFLDRFRKLGK